MADDYLISIVARLRDETRGGIDNLKRQIAELQAQAAASDLSSGVSDLANESDRAAQRTENLRRTQAAHRQEVQQSNSEIRQQAKLWQEGAESAGAHQAAVSSFNDELERARGQMPQSAASIEQMSQAHAKGTEQVLAHTAAHGDAAAAIRDTTAATSSLTDAQQQASGRGEELIQKMSKLDSAARAHTATNRELEVGYQGVANGLRSVWKQMDVGTREAERFGKAMQQAEQRAKNTDLARSSSGFAQFAQKLAGATDSVFPKIVSLSAELRGLRLVLTAGFMQPLLTGLLSLGAGFFSIASGAAQAAATLGGVFISGLGQLVPQISVAVAGLMALKNVFNAVQAAVQLQQQQFLTPNQGLINQLSTTNALIEAELNLKNAYLQVRQAQEQLAQSSLQILEARQALRKAEASGSQEAIQQARLQVRAAELARAQSANSLTQARTGVGVAQRQVTIEQLTAAQPIARESQAQATLQYLLGMMSPIEKKLYSELLRFETELRSPNSPLSKIASDFLRPFVYVGGELQKLLGDPKFLKPMDELAQTMGEYGTKFMKVIFGPSGQKMFETLAQDASKSIPIVEKALAGFIQLLGDISKAAAPAFRTLSQDWSNFWNALASKEGSASGQKRLTDFFNQGARWAEDFAHLAHSIVQLFMALGHDAAPQGMKTIQSLADAIGTPAHTIQRPGGVGGNQEITQKVAGTGAIGWVEQHGKEVTKFFHEANKGLGIIGKTLLDVGKLLVQAFSLSSLQAFSSLLTTLVLPAFKDFVTIVGTLVRLFTNLVNSIGPLKTILEVILGTGFALMFFGRLVTWGTKLVGVLGGVRDAFLVLTRGIRGVGDAFSALKDGEGILNRLKDAWHAFSSRVFQGKRAINETETAQKDLATTTASTDATMGAEDKAVASNEALIGKAALADIPEEEAALAAAGGGGAAAAGGGAAASGGILSGLLSKLGLGSLGLGGTVAAGYGLYEATKQSGLFSASTWGLGSDANNAANNSRYIQHLEKTRPQRGESLDQYLSRATGIRGMTQRQFMNAAQGEQGINQFYQWLESQGSFGSNGFQPTSQKTITQLGLLRDSLNNLKSPSDLTKQKLNDLYNQINSLIQQPDLTKAQREGLQKLDQALHSTRGNLAALKQEIAKDARIGAHGTPTVPGHSATGNWHHATPGGHLMNVGEGGYDEVTLTTDPRHAARSGSLLGRYLTSMDSGGRVPVIQRAVSSLTASKNFGTGSILDMIVAAFLNAQGGASSMLTKFLVGKNGNAGMTGTSIKGIQSGPWLSVASQIAKRMGWNQGQLSAWQGVESIEDGALSLTAKNPHSDAYGLAQFISGPSEYYRYGGDPNTIVGQLTGMANYIKSRYGTPMAALSHEHAYGWYAIGGRIGDHIRRMGLRHLRRKILHFASGGRAPWGGEPVPIIAHEGERISNPGQWDHIASLAGMTGRQLDHHMGYDSGRPRQFDVGGTVPYTSRQGGSFAGAGAPTLSNINSFLQNITTNLAQLDVGSVFGSLGTISQLSTVISEAFKKIGALGGTQTQTRLKQMNTVLENFADPNNVSSTLNMLQAAFQRFQNNLSDWVTGLAYLGGLRSGSRVARPRRGGRVTGAGDDLRMLGPTLARGNIGSTGTTALDLLNERSLVEQNQYLDAESKSVQTAIGQVKRSIERVKMARDHHAISSKTASEALKKLDSQYTNLIQQQENLGQSISSTVTQRFQAEQQYVQDLVGQINDIYQTQQAQLQGRQTGLQSLGQYGRLPSIDQAIAQSAKRQAAALQLPLREAERQHDAGAVAQIRQQIAQLQATVQQSVAQTVQDEISGIQQTFQTQQAKIQSKQSRDQALGAFSQLAGPNGIDAQLAASANAQIKALQKPLQEARKSGNRTAVAQIEQQIAQLHSTVAQSVAQMVQDAYSAVEQSFAATSAAQQSQQSIAQSLGQFNVSAQIDQTIVATTQQHIASLQTVLAQARKTGNQQLASQIQQQISQLQSTAAQAAAQIISDTISGIQQAAQTQQAQVSEYQSIAQTMQQNATTPGQFAAAGALNLQALNLNQTSLQSQLQQYNNLMAQAVSSGNVGAQNTIAQQIDQLTAQLAANTQALQDNTAKVVSETAAYIQSQGQFQTGTLGGLAQIISTIGQTTGFTDVGALKQLASASNTSLQGTNSGLLGQLAALGGGATGLASLLGSATTPQSFVQALSSANLSSITQGQDATWVQTFDTLIQNLTQNTEQIATNNQQLAQLNGQLLQPQQWSSTSWSAFRSAIFSGMGNLLPSYQSVLAGTSAMPTIAPVFSPVSGGPQVVPAVGTLNVNHAPLSSLAPDVVGEQLANAAAKAL